MNIKCPKCNTIFEIESANLLSGLKNFKCSVCAHIWEIDSEKEKGFESITAPLKKIIILNTVIFLVVLFSILIFRDRLEFSDQHWRNLFLFIDSLIPIK